MVRALYAQIRSIVDVAQAQQLPFMAAAIAYYAFLSLIPLLIVGLSVATVLAGQALANEILDTFGEFLTPETADLVEEAFVEARGRGGVTAVGLLVLGWGALRVFRGLDIAFSRVYGTTAVKPLPRQLRDASVVLLAIALAIGATATLSALVPFGLLPLGGFAGPLGLLVVLPFIFFPLYYFFPASDVTVREAIPGALFASAGWTTLGTVFGIYAAQAGSIELYGVLGGVLLLLVWFYFGGLLLLLGAVLNALLAGRFEDRQLQQGGPRDNSQQPRMTDVDDPAGDSPDGGRQPSDEPTEEPSHTDGPDTPATGRSHPVPDGGRDDEDGGRQDETGEVNSSSEDVDTVGEPPVDSDTVGEPAGDDTVTRADIQALRDEIAALEADLEERTVRHEELEQLESEISDRTVHRDEIESDLRRYVRWRVRRGHARAWGPYLVLLYGTIMTLGAFFTLGGGWAILAMVVIWLSTLGMYALMLIVGVTTNLLGLPRMALDKVRNLR